MQRKIALVAALAAISAVSMSACERFGRMHDATPPSDVASTTSPSTTPVPGSLPSSDTSPTASITPSPSDAPDPKFLAPDTPGAGSAVGGTHSGNTTDPGGQASSGAPVAPRAASEPTSGDGAAGTANAATRQP